MTRKWTEIDPLGSYRGNLPWLKERTIFLTVHGSQAYGTNVSGSDVDVKGLCIPPAEYFFGFTQNFEQVETSEPFDMIIYGLRKFMKLAADCNPNIIEVLHTDPEDWLLETPLFHKLYENRHLFLSQKARHTFSGYALAQLKRIKGHKSWLLDPPTHEPTREEFGLPAMRKMSKSDLGATQKLVEAGHSFDTNVMAMFKAEQDYHAAMRRWSQYQNWTKSRNPKRAALEAKHGYDCKHAMHLVRLMRMCEEILSEGKVLVRRPDAEELRAVRSGAWTYEELLEWAEAQDKKLDSLYGPDNKVLPMKPRRKELDELCQELVEESLR